MTSVFTAVVIFMVQLVALEPDCEPHGPWSAIACYSFLRSVFVPEFSWATRPRDKVSCTRWRWREVRCKDWRCCGECSLP